MLSHFTRGNITSDTQIHIPVRITRLMNDLALNYTIFLN
jgi:hypothetical protein